jgi:hypothetical protein
VSQPNRRSFLRETIALPGLLACAALLGGCWKKSEIVAQQEGKAFLRVMGNVSGVEMELDDSGTRKALDTEELLAEDVVLLQVLPGRHIVELYRGGERIVTRDLYFGHGQTIEIAVPQ